MKNEKVATALNYAAGVASGVATANAPYQKSEYDKTQDSEETKKRASEHKSGASNGAKYIGAFDEQNTEDAAGRK